MILYVDKGQYQIIRKKPVVILTPFLGSGVGVGILDKKNELGGLCFFVLPFKELNVNINSEEMVLSGESLLPIFFEELIKAGTDFSSSKIVVTGASVYKSQPQALNIGEVNVKVVKRVLRLFMISEDQVIFKVFLSQPLSMAVDLKENFIKLRTGGKEEKI